MQARKLTVLAVAVVSGVLAVDAAATVVIDTVDVGNPGNEPDTFTFSTWGDVSYSFEIGQYEITAGQYTVFLNAVAAADPYGLYSVNMADIPGYAGCNIQRNGTPGAYTYTVPPDWANRPVNHVSWGDAARFCNWLHNGQPTGPQDSTTTEQGSYSLDGATADVALLAVERAVDATWAIPSEDEWYKAAYHHNDGPTNHYWRYPTGTNALPSNDVLTPDPGNNANFRIAPDDYSIGSPYYRTPVGEFEESASPYGTFDQGGNVHEWTEGVRSGQYRALRGGSYYTNDVVLRPNHVTLLGPSAASSLAGFRVSLFPEPTTLSLLVLAGIGALSRKPKPRTYRNE